MRRGPNGARVRLAAGCDLWRLRQVDHQHCLKRAMSTMNTWSFDAAATVRRRRCRQRSVRFRSGVVALAVVAGGALGAAASPALGSSLAYLKDGVVWVSAPDGSDAHEVGMGLTYPALADNGTVYALTGSGQVDVLPPGVPAPPPVSINATHPTELSVSANGSNLAWMDLTQASESGRTVSVMRLSDGRRTARLSDQWPHWFSDTQVTMGGANGGELFDAGSNTTTLPWPESYTPPWEVSIDEYAINRAGTVGAGVVDYGNADIRPDPDAHTLVVFPAR